MKPSCGLLILSLSLLIGCGKKAPEQEAEVPEANQPTKPQGRADRGHVDARDGGGLKGP